MQVYLVGGAVRDELLGISGADRDFVVVGATIDEMRAQGFAQVGQDFPVFLHPETHEEYALARTERKHGHGYTGFICDFSPKTTLEEDLLRRDLTINAIAKNLETGEIIDPYGGLKDLKHKVLRHVSPAFVEDPLRVLRVARFAAKLHHCGLKAEPRPRGRLKKQCCQFLSTAFIAVFIRIVYYVAGDLNKLVYLLNGKVQYIDQASHYYIISLRYMFSG